MKAVFQLVLLVLVLVLVAMVSALTAMHFAIHGHEVVVPKLIGMTAAEAEREATASGLQFEVERQYYSPSIPEGKVMSQVPEAGEKVRRGWQIRAAQSLGPQRVTIPDVTGQTSRAAQLNITRRGLEVGTVASLPLGGSASDTVVAQSPPSNAREIAAPRISLLVAQPTAANAYIMPNFVGQSLGATKQVLQSSGMKLGSVKVASDSGASTNGGAPAIEDVPPSPGSLILSQEPAAGQRILSGSAVNFEVSR